MIDELGSLASIVTRGAESLGISLFPGAIALFENYYSFLSIRNQAINLTAIEGVKEVAQLHFLDSIALLSVARFNGANVIDIGSGAGFPGIPLKIADPSINLTLIDSTLKRVEFLSDLCVYLGLNVRCIHTRAEEATHTPNMRENYDIAVSRAVAKLNILCELCLPFVQIGGIFVAMKGIDSSDELSEANASIQMLGAELQNCFDYTIPETQIRRRVVIIKKSSITPDIFPRRFAKIQKKPL